eukprot:s140_g19.t1
MLYAAETGSFGRDGQAKISPKASQVVVKSLGDTLTQDDDSLGDSAYIGDAIKATSKASLRVLVVVPRDVAVAPLLTLFVDIALGVVVAPFATGGLVCLIFLTLAAVRWCRERCQPVQEERKEDPEMELQLALSGCGCRDYLGGDAVLVRPRGLYHILISRPASAVQNWAAACWAPRQMWRSLRPLAAVPVGAWVATPGSLPSRRDGSHGIGLRPSCRGQVRAEPAKASRVVENQLQRLIATARERGEGDDTELLTKMRLLEDELWQRGKVYRIVLTGGPCGGKSTVLSDLVQMLTEKNFLVFTMPECFRGIQMHIEDCILQMARQSLTKRRRLPDPPRGAVILLDRGVVDNVAYCTEEAWNMVQERLGTTTARLRDRRRAPSADGSSESARHESADEARDMDLKTQQAWLGCKKHYIVSQLGLEVLA